MEEWIDAMQPDKACDWILQMDIEGAEYEALLSLPERYLRKFRILVVEFHALDYLYDSNFFGLAASVFRKLLNNHACVHIHPNNAGAIISSPDFTIPKVMEFTFY